MPRRMGFVADKCLRFLDYGVQGRYRFYDARAACRELNPNAVIIMPMTEHYFKELRNWGKMRWVCFKYLKKTLIAVFYFSNYKSQTIVSSFLCHPFARRQVGLPDLHQYVKSVTCSVQISSPYIFSWKYLNSNLQTFIFNQ